MVMITITDDDDGAGTKLKKKNQVSNFSWDNGSHRRTCAKVGIYGFIFDFIFNSHRFLKKIFRTVFKISKSF